MGHDMDRQHLNINTYATADELAGNLAGVIIRGLQEGLDARGRASLVVSGGSTPKPLFAALTGQNFNWHGVDITLADERWVDTADQASNELLVRENLLQGPVRQARFLPLKNSRPTAKQGEEECHNTLLALTRPFDIVILGMGSDGHTASLFPCAEELETALDPSFKRLCLAITPETAGHERMTLTLPALLDSRLIVLHITGAEKKKVLERALENGPEKAMPVRAVLRQDRTPLKIYWAP